MSLNERCNIFEKIGARVIICGGISEPFEKLLKQAKLQLISGIAGNVEDVLSAYVSGCLDDPKFYMPGYKYGQKKPLASP